MIIGGRAFQIELATMTVAYREVSGSAAAMAGHWMPRRERGSITHRDWYELCRATSERVFAWFHRDDIGGWRPDRLQMLGVARTAFGVGMTLAVENMETVERLLRDFRSLDSFPYSDRDARRKAWNRIVDEERRRTA